MTLPRTDILMNRIRQESDIVDLNSINDFTLLNYMNDAQRTIQNIIFQADQLNNVFTDKTILTAVSGQVEYDLPFTVYAENSIISVWSLDSGNRPLHRYKKQGFGENSTLRGYSVQNRKIIFNHSPDQDMLIIYNTRLPLMSKRVGSIDLVGGATSTPSTITEEFTSDAGFTYDVAKAEFTAGTVRHIDQRPAGATLGVDFNVDEDGLWGTGDLTGTLGGTAAVNSGKVELTALGDYLRYDTTAKYSAILGAVKFKITFNTSGRQEYMVMFEDSNGSSGSNYFNLQFRNGSDDIWTRNPNGTISNFGGTFIPVAGQEYIFECSWNFTTGDIRLYIDGTHFGSPVNHVSASRTQYGQLSFGETVGTSFTPNYSIDDVIVYNTFQNTSNHVAAYTVPPTIYAETVVELPTMIYSGGGTFDSLVSLAETVSGSVKYVVDGKYWNGSAFVTSDDSYAQASTAAEINTNINDLTLTTLGEIPMKVVLEGGSQLQIVDELTWNILEIAPTSLDISNVQTGFDATEEYVSVVDKYGNIVVNSLYIVDFTDPTIQVEGSLTGVTINDYVVAGRNATSHSCLPEECETYLKAFVQRKALAHINSTKVSNSSIFTSEEREDLIDLFEDKHSDIEYPLITDYDYLDV